MLGRETCMLLRCSKADIKHPIHPKPLQAADIRYTPKMLNP